MKEVFLRAISISGIIFVSIGMGAWSGCCKLTILVQFVQPQIFWYIFFTWVVVENWDAKAKKKFRWLQRFMIRFLALSWICIVYIYFNLFGYWFIKRWKVEQFLKKNIWKMTCTGHVIKEDYDKKKMLETLSMWKEYKNLLLFEKYWEEQVCWQTLPINSTLRVRQITLLISFHHTASPISFISTYLRGVYVR
jgi:hypothetical protein